jgi:hypothetical protein
VRDGYPRAQEDAFQFELVDFWIGERASGDEAVIYAHEIAQGRSIRQHGLSSRALLRFLLPG